MSLSTEDFLSKAWDYNMHVAVTNLVLCFSDFVTFLPVVFVVEC